VPDDELTGLDRWILSEYSRLESEVIKAYDAYEFHVVYQKVSQFVAVELSAIYHDVIKDRLYTDPANSPRRRSTQTTLHRLVTGLCQMLAPILAFTADEAWDFVPGKAADGVHKASWQTTSFELSETESASWGDLFVLRERALPGLEQMRQAKAIGKSLEAKIALHGPTERISRLQGLEESLRELLNVSQLTLSVRDIPADEESGETEIELSMADGQKCERCWHRETDVGKYPEHPTLCARCVEAVKQVAT